MFFLFLNECFFSLSDCSSIVLVFITIYFLVSMIFVCNFFVTVNDFDRKKTEMELFPKRLTARLHDFRLIYCSMQYSEVSLGPSQTSMMDIFEGKVNRFYQVTIFAKSSSLDIWIGFQYGSVFHKIYWPNSCQLFGFFWL